MAVKRVGDVLYYIPLSPIIKKIGKKHLEKKFEKKIEKISEKIFLITL